MGWKFWKRKKPKGTKDTEGILENEELPTSALPSNVETVPIYSQTSQCTSYDVTECIERIGFGRYQWKIAFVMGLMSFADASEIWLSSVILKLLECEWNLTTIEKCLVPAVVLFWYAVGSILSGKFADKFGRWPCLLIAYYIICISAVASALSPTYIFFLIARSFTGFGIGSSYGVSVAYIMEMVPVHSRSFVSGILNIMWTAGGVYVCFVAIFVLDFEDGWRYEILAVAIPCFITLILLHFCDESPRYLVITGRDDEAKEILTKMCEQNGCTLPEGEVVVTNQKTGEYKDIYTQPHTRTSVVLTILFFCNMWVGYGILFLVPDMMSMGYCYMSEWFAVTHVTVNGCINYTKAEYIFFILVCFIAIPANIIGPWSCEKLGRIITLYYSVWAGFLFTGLLLICLNSSAIIYAELLVVVTLYYIYNAVLWLYTPEYYPTYIRSTAIGVINGISKFGAAGGTAATIYLDTYNIDYTIYTYLLLLAIASFVVLFVRFETRGEVLADGRRGEFNSNYGSVTRNTEQIIENDNIST